jgi:hypothetical protein
MLNLMIVLIGFFSKQFVLYSALQNGYYFISLIAIIVSVISASYYLKIIKVLHTDHDYFEAKLLEGAVEENKAPNFCLPCLCAAPLPAVGCPPVGATHAVGLLLPLQAKKKCAPFASLAFARLRAKVALLQSKAKEGISCVASVKSKDQSNVLLNEDKEFKEVKEFKEGAKVGECLTADIPTFAFD